MAQYNFTEIEKKWQKRWKETQLYKVENNDSKPKYYALDMFPYPSGAGLHVGHPLGYIASDIVSRYKRLNGHNVLHPMGYDSFGLPAEQYAIQTGQHPAITTEQNVNRFREQLDIMGFSYDWDRVVKTSDPNYYKWAQWIFSLFFTHYYDKTANKALPIAQLVGEFEKSGNVNINAHCSYSDTFTAEEWIAFDAIAKNKVLNEYRLAFNNETTVNWCEALGTVLANEEVVNGVSERGGHPVVRKKMKQWALRITAYADRLIEGLDRIDWSDSIKEIQRNWIGKSEGAEIEFQVVSDSPSPEPTTIKNHSYIQVFTTRPDTLFGATFMVLAPEYEGLETLCTAAEKDKVMAYASKAKNRSEIDRMADTKKTGAFTGAYAINPFTKKQIPIWVSDYVLAGYGTGAIMAVPAHDERDFEFAKAFDLEIIPVIKPADAELPEILDAAYSAKDGVCFNSGFLDGLTVKEAIKKAIDAVEYDEIGKRKINYKLREAGFGRQRYWGEPFPVVYDSDGIPHLVSDLPVELPNVESYKPTGTGESPLAAVEDWVNVSADDLELLSSPSGRGVGGEEIQPDSSLNNLASEPLPEYNNNNLFFAKEMRSNPTEAEALIWDRVRNKKLGEKFKRQVTIGNYIADFVCFSKKLIIELDGASHQSQQAKEYDEKREAFFHSEGFTVVRFWNSEVENSTDEVVDKINTLLSSLSPDPSPLKETGETPLFRRETDTMPGWAGSSWYFLRYMDPNNNAEFASKEALDYWKQVDLYIGGSEHATGHLLYSRFWTKFLFDLGYLNFDEPFKKLVNQGMITSYSPRIVQFDWDNGSEFESLPIFLSGDLDPKQYLNKVKSDYLPKYGIKDFDKLEIGFHVSRVPLNYGNLRFTENQIFSEIDLDKFSDEIKTSVLFKKYNIYDIIKNEKDKFLGNCTTEKMSKRWGNVVNPDDVCAEYGADTLRMYEMFLGPLTDSKPWNTNGIEGVSRFMGKFWRLFYQNEALAISNEPASKEELKVLHKTIKKITEDIENMSFNTSVSAFMVCVNELQTLKCNKVEILKPLLILLAPFAPHITEELWNNLGENTSIHLQNWPQYNAEFLVENSFSYPISINGKTRTNIEFPLDMENSEMEKQILANEIVQKWLEGKAPKKIIIVKGRIVNVVV